MQKIKVNDKVVVQSGKSKGAVGTVKKINKKTQKAVVEGVCLVTKSIKPSQTSPQGGFVKVESSVTLAKLALVDSKNKPSKIGIKSTKDGKLTRFYKSTKQEI